jgi:sodium-dependent phosphate cotransporter
VTAPNDLQEGRLATGPQVEGPRDEGVVPATVLTMPEASVPAARVRVWGAAGARLLYALAALALFILALEALKRGAEGITPVLDGIAADGALNIFGFGWLGAYVALSGSPVAAIALGLFSGGVIGDIEAFAMINGSRYGASFIVLLVGFVYYLGHRRNPDGLYVGVVALLTTFTVYVPSMLFGAALLQRGWLDGARFGRPEFVTSLVDRVFDPVVGAGADHLPNLLLFVFGVGLLLLSFFVFDRALPQLEPPGPRLERALALFHRPMTMFAMGLLVTAVTLSVSISLTLLVPLSLKGFVRRQSIIPYVMGANISTFVDTLVAAILLNVPAAVTIVLVQMVSVAVVSVLVLVLAYRPYRRLILGVAHRATTSRRGFAVFLGSVLVLPLILLLV